MPWALILSSRPSSSSWSTAVCAGSGVAHGPAITAEPLPLARDAQGLRWHGRLRLLSGPERIESDWWGTEGKRDYFIARHEQNGTLCWVFRDHHSRRWFLHGLFG